MGSRYDDEVWELVPEDPGPPPEHLREFVRSLGRMERALDLGCGDGRLTVELDAAELTAADVSVEALRRAEKRLDGARLVELEPDEPLPFEDSSFELVACVETIEHVRDLQLLLSEVRRVLLPGGRFAVTTPGHGRAAGLEMLALGFERRFDPLSPHVRFLTARSLRHLLDELGFEVESLRKGGGSLLAVARR